MDVIVGLHHAGLSACGVRVWKMDHSQRQGLLQLQLEKEEEDEEEEEEEEEEGKVEQENAALILNSRRHGLCRKLRISSGRWTA